MKSVKVYSTPTCPWCMKAKDWLKEHKVEFKNLDVSSDQKAADEMVMKSKQMGVPVLDIDGTIIVGFNEGKIKEALET